MSDDIDMHDDLGPGFALDDPAPQKTAAPEAQAYRVLARKYRPQRFSELIGQDAMITTLGNAIKRGRLAHAFLLTGVRGVGKTSLHGLLPRRSIALARMAKADQPSTLAASVNPAAPLPKDAISM